MSSRVIDPTKILDQVITTTITTKAMRVSSFSNCAFQVNYAVGLTATFKVMGSIDGKNFGDIGTFVPTTDPLASSVSMANISGIGFFWIALQIIPSAGSSSVQVWFSAKEA